MIRVTSIQPASHSISKTLTCAGSSDLGKGDDTVSNTERQQDNIEDAHDVIRERGRLMQLYNKTVLSETGALCV